MTESVSTKSLSALDRATIARLAPSVFTDHAAPGVSERYRFANTWEGVQPLIERGYVVTHAAQGATRRPDSSFYSKHVLRLTHQDQLTVKSRAVGDVLPQVIITNSHDRSTAFHIVAGMYRLWCANGMASSIGQAESVRIGHTAKDIERLIIDGTDLIREVTDNYLLPRIEAMDRFELTHSQAMDFALAANYLRNGRGDDMVQARELLATRRAEDDGRSLWAVLNRVQENAVKGGYDTQDARGRNVQARGITSVSRDLDFNLRLMDLGNRVLDAVTA